MNSSIVVIDNGASTLKAGAATRRGLSEPRLILNAVVKSAGDKKTYYGHEIDNCQDYSSLHYRLPFEKGFLTDWDAQKAVWDGLFSSEVLGVDTSESSLLITEPYFNLPNIQDVYDQFVFEEYDFQSYLRCTPAFLIPHGDLYAKDGMPPPECMIIVDSGFSFTHVVPILAGKVVWNAVRRLDVGGKLLTNQLKEHISYRQWNMMDQTHIMNQVKEACCYVSADFGKDLQLSRSNATANPIIQEYVLPDLSINQRGRIRQPQDTVSENDQVVIMNNERFTIPEIMFRPDDIGLNQSGLSATIATSISLLPDDLQGMFWANIGLIGGTTKIAGFRNRLMTELRSLAPVEADVEVYECAEPITECYRSAVAFARSSGFYSHALSRAEYMESGSNAARRKFASHDWRGQALREGGKGKQREEADQPKRLPRKSEQPTVGRPRTRTKT